MRRVAGLLIAVAIIAAGLRWQLVEPSTAPFVFTATLLPANETPAPIQGGETTGSGDRDDHDHDDEGLGGQRSRQPTRLST